MASDPGTPDEANDHATSGGGPSSDSGEGEEWPSDHRLGFTSLEDELDDVGLPVSGSIPGWLEGTLLRNGPGRFEAGEEEFQHWFDGLAMVRRFAFDDGTVRYSNRHLRTEAYAAATGGAVGYGEFGTMPDRGPVERLLRSLAPETTDNAPVHVARLCGETTALTETPHPVAFDPDTLATRAVLSFDDDLPDGHATAHHLQDPERGETWGYVTEFGPRSAYHVWRLPHGSCTRELVGSVPVDEPAYVHSFGLTEDYVVITESPFVTHPLSMLVPTEKPFVERYEWKPWREMRFLVLERTTGNLVAQPRAPPAFVFHHAKVVQRGDRLLVDLVAFDDPRIVRGLSLDRVRRSGGGGGGDLARYEVPLEGDRAERRTVYEGIALPRVGVDRTDGADYRYVYGQSATEGEGFAGGVVKIDVETGEAIRWTESGRYAGEPVFVPSPERGRRPDPELEDDGVVLVVVLEADRGHSSLVVLDGGDLSELGRARLPHHLPFGFHGRYFASEKR